MLQFENEIIDIPDLPNIANATGNRLVKLAKQIGYPMPVYMFKWTDDNGTCHGGGSPYKYSLPTEKAPGRWHSKDNTRNIVSCSNGFHCSSLRCIHEFIGYGPRLFLVEVAGRYDLNYGYNYNGSYCDMVAVEKIRLIYEFEDAIKYCNNRYDNIIFRWLLDNFEFPVGTVLDFKPWNNNKHSGIIGKDILHRTSGGLIGTLNLENGVLV